MVEGSFVVGGDGLGSCIQSSKRSSKVDFRHILQLGPRGAMDLC